MHLSVLSVRSEKILLYLEHNYLKRNGFQCKNTTDKWKNCDRWQISLLETDEKKKKETVSGSIVIFVLNRIVQLDLP